jgi:hypothetical protein
VDGTHILMLVLASLFSLLSRWFGYREGYIQGHQDATTVLRQFGSVRR